MSKLEAYSVSINKVLNGELNGGKNWAPFYYNIPIYQRNYNWTNNEINVLIEDISNFMSSDKFRISNYFMGNIIIKKKDEKVENNSEVKPIRYMVVDGQQRITTFILLVKAMQHILSKITNINEAERIIYNIKINEMLFAEKDNNPYKLEAPKERRIKLENIVNSEILEKILSEQINSFTYNNSKSEIPGVNYIKNYNELVRLLNQKINGDALEFDKWFSVLEHLIVVIIQLEESDEEHMIFENINSKGKDLSIFDLIKNYFYMHAEKYLANSTKDKADNLQQIFEINIPRILKEEQQMVNFLRYFIAYKTSNLINRDSKLLFQEYKKISNLKSEQDLFDEINLLNRLVHYYEYLVNFNLSNFENENELILWTLKENLVGAYFPLSCFIMDQYFAFDETLHNLTLVNEDEFYKAMRVIDNYRFKLLIGGTEEKNLTRFLPKIKDKFEKQNLPFSSNNLLMILRGNENEESNSYNSIADADIKTFLGRFDVTKKINTKLLSNLLLKIEYLNSDITNRQKIYSDFNKYQIIRLVPTPSELEKINNPKYNNYIKSITNDEIKLDDFNYYIGNLILVDDTVKANKILPSFKSIADVKNLVPKEFISNRIFLNSSNWDYKEIEENHKYLINKIYEYLSVNY